MSNQALGTRPRTTVLSNNAHLGSPSFFRRYDPARCNKFGHLKAELRDAAARGIHRGSA